MNAHGIEILDRADDDDVVGYVAHHLHFVLFPSEYRFFQQHFVHRRERQPVAYFLLKLFAVVGNATASAAQRIACSNDSWQPDFPLSVSRLLHVSYSAAARNIQANRNHRLLERFAAFRLGNHIFTRADHLDAQLIEDSPPGQIHRRVQTGLPAQCWQQCVGSFLFDDFLHVLPGDRLNVCAVGRVGVCHDGGWVGIHQHHLVPLFSQCLARLRSRIVEFARLADHNRTGTNNQYFVDVVAAGHGRVRFETIFL